MPQSIGYHLYPLNNNYKNVCVHIHVCYVFSIYRHSALGGRKGPIFLHV